MAEHEERPEEQEEKTPSQVDFLVEPTSDEELEDVSGGCTNCSDGCSPH